MLRVYLRSLILVSLVLSTVHILPCFAGAPAEGGESIGRDLAGIGLVTSNLVYVYNFSEKLVSGSASSAVVGAGLVLGVGSIALEMSDVVDVAGIVILAGVATTALATLSLFNLGDNKLGESGNREIAQRVRISPMVFPVEARAVNLGFVVRAVF